MNECEQTLIAALHELHAKLVSTGGLEALRWQELIEMSEKTLKWVSKPAAVICEACRRANTERYENAGGLEMYFCQDCGWHQKVRGTVLCVDSENPVAIKPASENNRNDTMEYWRSRATTAEQKILEFHEQTSKLATDYAQHLAHVQRFLTEMYQVMVDPVEEFDGNIEQLCALLIERAKQDRETMQPRAETPTCERISKQLVIDWLTGYAGPQEPEFFGQFLEKLEWRIANEPLPNVTGSEPDRGQAGLSIQRNIASLAAAHEVELIDALRQWEHWYSVDSSEFNRYNARENGLNLLRKYRAKEFNANFAKQFEAPTLLGKWTRAETPAPRVISMICKDCGGPMVWQNEQKIVLMCPNCVMERCIRAELKLGWYPHPPAPREQVPHAENDQ